MYICVAGYMVFYETCFEIVRGVDLYPATEEHGWYFIGASGYVLWASCPKA